MLPLILTSRRNAITGSCSDAQAHAVQPASERCRLSDRGGPAGEYEEGSLKRIFGILVVAQNASADAPNKTGMPLQQCREGIRVAQPRKSGQQHVIRKVGALRSLREAANVVGDSH